MTKGRRNLLIALIIILGAGAGGWFYKQQRLSAWDAETASALQEKYPDMKKERMLAEIYWTAYPDVATHDYFGRKGRLGIYGARAHYLRHGRTHVPRGVWPNLK